MTASRSRSRASAVVVQAGVLCLMIATGARLSAHPTATSFVVITRAADARVTATITTEASPLLMKLEALAGVAASPAGLADAAVDARIAALGATLLDHVSLEIDGAAAVLTADRLDRRNGRPNEIQIVLTSEPIAAAATLRWHTSLFFGSYPLAVRADSSVPESTAAEQYEWLSGSEVSQSYVLATLGSADSGWTRAGRVVAMGFTHIVPGGLDHVLFVLGLFLLASNLRTLLLQISAFTVAHSLTLALAMTGWIAAPARVIEPLIAVSIAYVAIENLMTTSLSRWRLAVVFVFGLLHGLGFASALADLGLSRGHFATTLIGFNVGVELGQIAVVLAATLVVRSLPVTPESYRRWLVRPASAAIAAAGVFWAVQRVLS